MASRVNVRLLSDRGSLGLLQHAGDVIDVPKDEARRLLAARLAEPVETAMVEPETEKAIRTTRERRGRSRGGAKK